MRCDAMVERVVDSDPMGHPLASFTASKSLVLRSASALDSQKCGLLKRGKRVVVLEESFKNKGVHRSRVALESDLGTPLGWVTRDKRGRELLKTMRSAEGELGFYTSLRSEYRGKKPCAFTARLPAPCSRKPNSSSSDSPEASNDCADSPNADSLASRVAGRRRDSIARRASRASTARASTRASVLSADSPLAPALKRQATRALPPELCHQSTATSIAAASLPRLSAIQLRRAARACVVRAEGLDQTFETFHSEFAKLLRQKQMTVDELLASWDRNGDGSISRQEFRINVRALGFRVSTREVDGLFECIDEDGGGELDLRELKVALRRLQADAAAVSAKTDAQRERAATLLGVGSKFETAASAASEYEASEALLQQLTHFPSLEKRIGDVLIKRNVKIGELVAKWDQDGDGTIDRREFEQKVVELGLETDDAHLDALFKRLDDSGDGLLDLDEMKATLTRLRESAYDGAAKLEAQVNQTSQLKKQANGAAEAARTALKEYDEQLTLDDLLLAS